MEKNQVSRRANDEVTVAHRDEEENKKKNKKASKKEKVMMNVTYVKIVFVLFFLSPSFID